MGQKKEEEKQKQQQAQQQQAAQAPQAQQQAPAAAPAPPQDVSVELKKLADLHSSGVLTDQEFAESKKKLLEYR
jgi:hypothetical protein